MLRRLSRRHFAAVAVGIVLIGATAIAWLWWLPGYRPPLRDGEQYGIDVAHHQGSIDWPRVASDGIAFAYIKASEGATHVDPEFSRNWGASGNAGLIRGAYHFFTLCRGGAEQAHNFLSTAPVADTELPPAVDLEFAGNCAARPPREEVHRELGEFLHRVEAVSGRPSVLYVGPDLDRHYNISATLRRPVWRLRALRRPPQGEVTIWQVGGFARVEGISTRVDLNVADLDPLLAATQTSRAFAWRAGRSARIR